jgi:hypothetical protein
MSKKEKESNITKIEKIFSCILVLSSLLFLGVVTYTNVLPMIYLITVILLVGVTGFLSIYKILSRKARMGIKVFFYIFIILLNIVFILGSFFIFKTRLLLNSGNIDYKTHNYSVVVLKSSKYNKLKDIRNESMGYFDNKVEGLEESIKEIESKINISMVPYKDLESMGYALLFGEVDSIVVEDPYKSILENSDDNSVRLAKFKSLTKTIYTFSVKTKQKNISKEANVTKVFLKFLETATKY